MDLAERLERLQERNSEPLPEGKHYSDEDAKAVFLTALEEGKTIPEAARLAGRTASWFRRRRNRDSWQIYDADFTNRFDEIVAPGGSHMQGLGLRGLTNLAKASDEGSVRASEKLMAAYHGDFSWLKQQAAQGSLNVEQLQVFFGELPLEKLMELKEAREKARKELPPVIDQ